jgi:hypothetical protein
MYVSGGNSISEKSVFSNQNLGPDCILHQDSMGAGQANQGSNGYQINNVVDPSKPFILNVRARVLEEEGDIDNNHFGFGFEVGTGTEAFAIMIGPSVIQALDNENENRVLSTSIDNTKFHNYRLEGTPGVGYKFYVDDYLVAIGTSRVMEGDNRLYLGDGTGGTNAKADVASFEFTQGVIAQEQGSAPNIDLTGDWSCSLGGDYYIRQLGNSIMWYGEAAAISPYFSNVAYGWINGNIIDMTWADVPKGTNSASGSLKLVVSSNDEINIKEQTGGWGGNLWRDFRLTRKTHGF